MKSLNCIISSIIILIFGSFIAENAAAQGEDSLSSVLMELDSTEAARVSAAILRMPQVCDQSCVPYIIDLLRSSVPSIVTSACQAAGEFGNPRFSPALIDIVRSHPMDDVRADALRALIRVGNDADYRMLLESVDTSKLDSISRLILRSLPDSLTAEMASEFAFYCRDRSLTSSVVQAYRHHPEVLLHALFRELSVTNDAAEQIQLLRAVSLIMPFVHDPSLSPEAEMMLWNIVPEDKERLHLTASIQAARSTADAVLWVLAFGSQLPPDILYHIIDTFNDDASSMLMQAMIDNDSAPHLNDLSYSEHIRGNSALEIVFLRRMPASAEASKIAEKYLYNNASGVQAIQALGRNNADVSLFLRFLGSANYEIALAAMRSVGAQNDLSEASSIVFNAREDDDDLGKVYLARWAIAMILSREKLSQNRSILNKLADEMKKCVSNSRRLHAEPALALLNALNIHASVPSSAEFRALRPEMKRVWLEALDLEKDRELILLSLMDEDAGVRAKAIQMIGNNAAFAWTIEDFDTILKKCIEDKNSILSINAEAAAGRLHRTALIPVLQKKLISSDPREQYNALWALQNLRALPDQNHLKVMYYRARDEYLRSYLGFLSGIEAPRSQTDTAVDLKTGRRQPLGEYIQLLFQDSAAAGIDISFLMPDNAIVIERANGIGMVKVPDH